MPALAPIFKKAYWSLAFVGGLYAVLMLCLTNTWLQRHALYAHKLHSGWWHPVDEPQSFGFARNQVTPFNITTSDGETLYAWHILPLGVYAKHEAEILNQPDSPASDFTRTVSFKLLTQDPSARVVLNFHGNAGHVAQSYRPSTYRSLTSASTVPPVHILTIDYRGFGHSTGFPSEAGLITDGTALVSYVLSTLRIPPERIVLLGQSLGTAVASAVALGFAAPGNALAAPAGVGVERGTGDRPPVDFAGVVLVASFTSLPVLLETYRIAGVIPILSPLRAYPFLQRWLVSRVADRWDTAARIGELVRVSKGSGRRFRLHLVHARDDWDIWWRHSEELFYVAVNASTEKGVDKVKWEEKRMMGGKREKVEMLRFGSDSVVLLEILEFGGHNFIVTTTPVALAVLKAFGIP